MKKTIKKSQLQSIIKEVISELTPKERTILKSKLMKENDMSSFMNEANEHFYKLEEIILSNINKNDANLLKTWDKFSAMYTDILQSIT